MKVSKRIFGSVVVATLLATSSYAVSYPPAPAPMDVVTKKKTTLGYVRVNPYGNSPLTAMIDLGGEIIKDVKVKVHGKGSKGIPVEYNVGKKHLQTHDGIPIFGLYQGYKNRVTVTFTNTKDNKKYTHNYNVLTSNIENKYIDNRNVTALPEVKVVKVAKGFKDKLFLTNTSENNSPAIPIVWAGQMNTEGISFTATPPSAGSLTFSKPPMNFIVDSQGEYRWWINSDAFYDMDSLNVDKMGYVMGINETKDGNFTFLMNNTYGEFDLMGRIIYKLRLPQGYIDASHEIIEMPNGNLLIRVAKANYKRPDGDIVHTVRDFVIEITKTGTLVEVWDFNKILDNQRDVLLMGMDQGAVCLNVNLDAAGHTAGETKGTEPDAPYGDISGIGAGRNWLHINSIAYDKKDDSIIVSARHQGVIKVGRDKKVKWILAPRADWKPNLAKKLLTPVDSKGKKLNCDENGVCENTDFDFSWTQHTAWLSPNGTLTVLDNGDGRHNTQPAMAEDKYTRFVEYKIDEKNMTVQQLWEYGKERGYKWYSPVTSNVQLITNDGKPYMYGFNGSTGLFVKGTRVIGRHNIIDYKTKDVLVEIDVHQTKPGNPHYRGVLIEPERVFNK